jgi:chemotaxis protein CheD
MKSLRDTHLPHVFLKPGELFLSRDPAIVSTVLGSCVSVIFFEPSARLGAMCHVMLPSGPMDEGFRFVDSTLGYMVEKIGSMGVRLDSCDVKMFGGADVLLPRELEGVRLSIGTQNINEAQRRLDSFGLVPMAKDVGGKHGRKLFFNSHTGEVFMKKVQKTVYL